MNNYEHVGAVIFAVFAILAGAIGFLGLLGLLSGLWEGRMKAEAIKAAVELVNGGHTLVKRNIHLYKTGLMKEPYLLLTLDNDANFKFEERFSDAEEAAKSYLEAVGGCH